MLIAMYPTLGPIPIHGLFVGLGVLAAIGVFVVEARRRGQTDEKVVYVVLGALLGRGVSPQPDREGTFVTTGM